MKEFLWALRRKKKRWNGYDIDIMTKLNLNQSIKSLIGDLDWQAQG